MITNSIECKQSSEKSCVVTGAAGMLGSALIPALRQAGYEVYATDIVKDNNTVDLLDVRNYDSISNYFHEIKPKFVFHLAAETDVDKCELSPDHAFMTNALGTQNVCLATRDIGATMIYISTAGVFDGEKSGYYNEFDKPNPINIYGKTKYEGEIFVEKLCGRYFIVRAGWMIGGGEKDKKFTAKIIKQLKDGVEELYVVNDKFGTPTYNVDFSRVLCWLAQTNWYGVYHAACTGTGSRLDVAREILKFLDRNDVKLIPVTSDFFQNSYPAPRPKSEMMRNYVLELRGYNAMRPWKTALSEYLRNGYQAIGDAVL